MRIYIAEFSYGTARLWQAEAEETSKLYKLDTKTIKEIIGRAMYARQIKKGDITTKVFAGPGAALDWLIEQAHQYYSRTILASEEAGKYWRELMELKNQDMTSPETGKED